MKTYLCPFPPMTREEYDAIDAVNWSTLKYALKSGLHYKHCLTSATPETDEMRLGRAVHTAVFEPGLFGDEYVVWEGGRRAGGSWEDFRAAYATRTILRPEDAEHARTISDAVHAHPVARQLLRCGASEVSVTWKDRDTGIVCKGRPDWLCDAALVDLKTTRDIDIKAFGRHGGGLLYHGQLAYYQMGLAANGIELPVKIIAVESSPPYDVAVYEMDEDTLWAGEIRARQALATVAQCRKTRTWPGRYPAEVSFMLPAWEFPGEDEIDAVIGGGV